MIDVCFEVVQTCVIYCTVIFILKLLNVIFTPVHEFCCYFTVNVKCILFQYSMPGLSRLCNWRAARTNSRDFGKYAEYL